MHHFITRTTTALLALAALAGFGAAAQAESIKYIGSSTVGRFMHDAAQVYNDTALDINTKPESGGGENATASGHADIGGVAREVKQEILAKGVKKYLIGRDAIGVLVNASNPVDTLSLDQLKGIFSGKISNWSEVGGKDMAINVYIVNPQSATRKVFAKSVLGDADYGGKRIQTVRPDPAILDKVAGDEGAIGQLSFALIGEGKGVKRVRPDGQEASVSNPDYPITRPLYLITKGDPKGPAKAFIDWAMADEGQSVVKRYFVGR